MTVMKLTSYWAAAGSGAGPPACVTGAPAAAASTKTRATTRARVIPRIVPRRPGVRVDTARVRFSGVRPSTVGLGPMDDERRTDSGIEIRPVYTAGDLEGFDPDARLGRPGEPPYTRGIYEQMYRSRYWTMRQYAGFGTAEETNGRFHYLLEHGQTGLSCAFDLPTQMGYDSDHPRAQGEVGKVGVAIDSLEDMERLLAGLPLDEVSTSMT